MSLLTMRRAARFVLAVPPPGLADRLDRILAESHATPHAHVAVTGPAAGEAMSLLWRRGFARVEAARRATCPSADERCDLLLALGCRRWEDARAALAATRAMLRPGGLAVADLGGMPGAIPQAADIEAIGLRWLARRGEMLLAARPAFDRRAA